ncbi:hypothetical protein [Litoreibacter janthinus]|uniref:Uncharacterized protein n=1 Tax=Litoreibacter janthinus TaxID=670154 RepID=A0A1I6FYJ5_9RHOB|nr:hypothetical protein [Litoreibacter janthinus]SFR34907.1 hypothetical protein SAMN04488002_0554 [Litoreibacter janthinus]
MYDGDSFFTLTAPKQAGLLVLSALLMFGWVYGCWRFNAERKLILRLFIALASFMAFVWLSPQIYYQYYRLIFEGLPAQFVIGWPEGLGHIVRLLTFQSDATLSAHSQGILGWVLFVSASLRR